MGELFGEWLKDSIVYYVIAFIIVFVVCAIAFGGNEKAASTSGGFCQIEGSYRRRVVKCFGDYSIKAKNDAQKKATECNMSDKPISGCDGLFQ